MNQPAPFLHWGFILISLPNLLLILVMIALFVLALVLPLPGRRQRRQAYEQAADDPVPDPQPPPESASTGKRSWTVAVRQLILRELPPEHLLPDREPAYVGSWVYVFGVVTIASLVWVLVSGVVLSIFGPQWWQVSPQGHLVNSIHFWSVQMFFIFMVLHLWGQYFAAGWREGRASTWMIGLVVFLVSLGTAFTGYLSQQNFNSQWIALNAKDAVNTTGVGAFFNVLNFGQMYGLHVMLFPIMVTLLIVLHIVQVRRRGVVKPIERATPS
jgi:quinol-cytochrome oxidoreductase complex cytochrome b subunit